MIPNAIGQLNQSSPLLPDVQTDGDGNRATRELLIEFSRPVVGFESRGFRKVAIAGSSGCPHKPSSMIDEIKTASNPQQHLSQTITRPRNYQWMHGQSQGPELLLAAFNAALANTGTFRQATDLQNLGFFQHPLRFRGPRSGKVEIAGSQSCCKRLGTVAQAPGPRGK